MIPNYIHVCMVPINAICEYLPNTHVFIHPNTVILIPFYGAEIDMHREKVTCPGFNM